MKLLTVIVPFLNEKYEVENTLKSIIEHSTDDVEIILINDASNDGFDYKEVAERYDVTYFENKERMGVAPSRDKGVELCQTPYFLLLDAHMRFYDNQWVDKIISELKNDERTLLCCQSKALRMSNGLVVERTDRVSSYGACIELNHQKEFIHASWITNVSFDLSQNSIIPIVCVLGAGYACSKFYWQYLKGLEGLVYYGSDEPYISMKVWLEGGSCKLLTDVVIGHIYRTGSVPYNTNFKYRLYNQLLIGELLLPHQEKRNIFREARRKHHSAFSEVLLMLYESSDLIDRLKQYYHQIFTRDYSFFETMNNEYQKVTEISDSLVDGIDQTLQNIAKLVQKSPKENVGIHYGNMGASIYLFHYGRVSGDEADTELAEKVFNEIIINIQPDIHYGFTNGLAGIGWGIQYLYQQGFVEGDINEILEDFDRRIMEVNPERIINLNRDYGLGGIVCYLLARLYTIEKEQLENPFDQDYLKSIYKRIDLIMKERNISCDSIDLFLEFINYYDNKQQIVKPEIIDVCPLSNPRNIHIQDLPYGLNGVSGVGLKLIFEKEQSASNF